ncbi:helix-turn-helix domain-containing protein, partial [Streptomyces hundungensis]|uniref:helix-turn-helix domain-containing protein n=1 Tax=Streptomyces hundungensis TaxID=1077946 RepID=UPI0033E18893
MTEAAGGTGPDSGSAPGSGPGPDSAPGTGPDSGAGPAAPRRRGRPPRAVAEAGPGTRERILSAARTEFSGRGYDKTSMRGIAKAAGVDASLVQPAQLPLLPAEQVGCRAELAAHDVPVTDVGVPVAVLAVLRPVVEVGQVEDVPGLVCQHVAVRRVVLEDGHHPVDVPAVRADGPVEVHDLRGVGVDAGRVRVGDQIDDVERREVDRGVGGPDRVRQI